VPFYKYTAKNKLGEKVKGKIEAKNEQHAAGELQTRELLVIDIHLFTDDVFSAFKGMLGGVKQNDVVAFTRQLATMINAGLPLANGLSILVRQSKPEMARLIATMLQEIEAGNAFGKALMKFPKSFNRIYVQLVNAGEMGGVLDTVLERLAENMEKDKEFRAKTKGAMIYPVIVVIAMFAVGFVMMIFVIPQLTEMYNDFGAELPLPTRILIALSDFMVAFWWLVLGAIGFGIFLLKNWYKTETGERAIDGYLFKLPIIGELRKKIILTEYTRTMSLMLGAGVSLLQSLEIVTDGVGSISYRTALKDVYAQIEKGTSLSAAMSRYDIFPPILHQMMSVGEETGKLDEVLFKLSRYFEQESEQEVKNLTTAIEPLIMVVLGLGVGVMVIAIIMPIYELTSQF
jgi:type IV pilus assembly protein PilC